MSAILGMVRFDGRPVTESDIQPMMHSMAGWGTDARGSSCNRGAGMGSLLLYNTPESLFETVDCESACGRYLYSAHARLDNRPELLSWLDIHSSLSATTADGHLIWGAYQKWGEDCVHRLLGDWIFAVWDKLEEQLFIARDHFGMTGLIYYHGNGLFAFSSGLQGLLAHSEIPKELNEQRVAEILTCSTSSGNDSVYRHLYRLPPAHTLRVSKSGLKLHRYWRAEDVTPIRLGSDEDYIDAFHEIFHQAVCCRLRSHRDVGVTLSGGLDSGSVAAIAAPELARQGKTLPAYSSVSLFDSSRVMPEGSFEESEYIRASASHIGNIDLNLVRSENVSILGSFDWALDNHCEPVHAASTQYWSLAIWQMAKDHNIGTMLTGEMGNFTVSWAGTGYLPQLLREWKWLSFIKEFSAYRRERSRHSLFHDLRNQVVAPLLPLSAKRIYRGARGRLNPSLSFYPINPVFAERLEVTRRMYESGHDPLFGLVADTLGNRIQGLKVTKGLVGSRVQRSTAPFRLESRDPTTDKRMLEFCLGIPDEQYLRAGKDRLLIRRAMSGKLPEKVLQSPGRGLQSDDLGYRLVREMPAVNTLLQQLRAESPLSNEILDLKKLQTIATNFKPDSSFRNVMEVRAVLLRGLLMGVFLKRFEAL